MAFGSDVLTGGSDSSGANSSCQCCWKALSGQIGRANGNWVDTVYFNPRRVYTSERVHHAYLGVCRFKMSSQYSSWGRTSEAYLVIASCCTSRTQLLGQTHGHSKLAPSVWGGDGPFCRKLPYTIPVLKGHRTGQMDKVGGYFVNPGLFHRHGNLRKVSMDDQNSKCIILVEGIYGRM